MIGNLFRCRKPQAPERASFRPVLESLESREVPSTAQVSAAFTQLTTDMSTLQAAAAARPVNTDNFTSSLTAVATDMVTVGIGASGFTSADRLQIDGALYSDGWALIFDGYSNIGALTTSQFANIVALGFGAVEQGFWDGYLTNALPGSSGTATLS